MEILAINRFRYNQDFSNGNDFRLFKEIQTVSSSSVLILGDSGYQCIANLHQNSQIPVKNSKYKPLTKQIYNHNLSS